MTDFDYSRLTVHAYGPVVEDDDRGDGLNVARESEAQIDREIRGQDDLDKLLVSDDDTGKVIKAVSHLIKDEDDLRFPKGGPPSNADMAHDWTITVKGDVQAWIDLAWNQGKPNPSAIDQRKAKSFMERIVRKDSVGSNAYPAALQVAHEDGDQNVVKLVLEHYKDQMGIDDGGDGDD